MKKAQAFMTILLLLTLISLGSLMSIMMSKKKGFPRDIGERQFDIHMANNRLQKALFYIDQSAELAEEQTAFEYTQTRTDCSTYIVYPLLNKPDEECWNKDTSSAYVEQLNIELDRHLVRYSDIYIPTSNYECTGTDLLTCNAYMDLKSQIAKTVLTVTEFTPAVIVGEFAWPSSTDTVVTSCLGKRNVDVGSKIHEGIDLRAKVGSPVFSVSNGTVINLNPKWGGVTIEHEGGLESRYLHNSVVLVKEDDTVEKGQVIARAGNTGPIDVPVHIHFELKKDGKLVDPIESIFKIDEFDIYFTRNSNCYYNAALNNYPYRAQIMERLTT